MDLLECFPPGLTPRDAQRGILREVGERIASGHRRIVLSAPPGVGKSAVAMAIARAMGSSFIVTATRQLQDQYAADFAGLRPVKGMSNFACLKLMEQRGAPPGDHAAAARAGLTCEKGECVDRSGGTEEVCRFRPDIAEYEASHEAGGTCLYYEQKYDALLGSHSVWNYHSYFNTLKYGREAYGARLSRGVVIYDEAHTLEDQLLKFVSVQVRRRHADECGVAVARRDLAGPEELVRLLDAMVEGYGRRIRRLRGGSDQTRASAMEDSRDAFSRARDAVAGDPGNFVVNEPEWDGGGFSSVEAKPLDLSGHAGELLAAPLQVFMSATIDRGAFCRGLGLPVDGTALVDTPRSPFPPEHRRVEFLDVARPRYGGPPAEEERIWAETDAIMSRHAGQRGLVLTSSVARCRDIISHLSAENRARARTCHASNPGGLTQDEVLREHAASDAGVLVSSSLWQGADLRDGLSRFQVIAKAPYPNYGEAWVRRKMEASPLWYPSQTVSRVLQGLGRSVRSEEDWAVTYVLDSAVGDLLRRSRAMVPRSYHDSLGWEG